MINRNDLQKRIIKALANAPITAIQRLIDETDSKDEKEHIKRVASALNVNLGGVNNGSNSNYGSGYSENGRA